MRAALAAFALAGCYLSHERPAPVDGGSDAPAPAPRCTFAPVRTAFVTDTPFAAHGPRLGWDGEQLGLLVFESDGSIGHPVVSFTRVDGALTAPPLTLAGESSHSWVEAAWDERSGFALCWSGDPGSTRGRTLGRMRGPDGVDRVGLIELDPDGGACEGVARLDGRWAFSWRHGAGASAMRVAVLDDDGGLRGMLDLDAPLEGGSRGALLAADTSTFVAAVPFEGVGLEMSRIDRDGALVDRTTLAAPEARYGALAVHDDGTIGLAIRDGEREVSGLRFVRLGPDLTLLPGETRIVSDGRGVRYPRVLAVPDGWAISWVERGDDALPATAAVLAHLDRAGVPIEPRRVLVDGENSNYGGPSLAFHGGTLYAAIARPPGLPGGHEQVEITRLTCEDPARARCAPMEVRSEGRCSTLFGYAWDGSRCAPIGCMCAGSECDRVSRTEEECIADHEGC